MIGLGIGGLECERRRARKRPTQPPPEMTIGRWEVSVALEPFVGCGPSVEAMVQVSWSYPFLVKFPDYREVILS